MRLWILFISLNPILHSFQEVVHQCDIEKDLIDGFLDSMEMDLNSRRFDKPTYEKYIFGSAEVVGLMCLKVFVKGDDAEYERLKTSAMKLGSAFQKVNFLRDVKSDYYDRGRVYFPDVLYDSFTCSQKSEIESEIQQEFDDALIGIRQLPKGTRLGVFTAYTYYQRLLKKIKRHTAADVKETRIRVSDGRKVMLLGVSAVKSRIGTI